MRRIAVFFLMIMLVVPLMAGASKWKKGSSETGITDTYGLKLVFKGADYNEIGFSQIPATLSDSNGILTTSFDTGTLTLTGHDLNTSENSSGNWTTSTKKDSNGNTVDYYNFTGSCYLYWYVSYTSPLYLKLEVKNTDKFDDAITVKVAESLATKGTIMNTLVSTDSESGSTTNKKQTLVNIGSSDKVGYTYGSRYLIISVDVTSYPENGKVGDLILTLETSA